MTTQHLPLAAWEARWRPSLGGSLLAQELGVLIPEGVLIGLWLTRARPC